MSHDWIKMRGALVNHPKVIAMTRVLLADNDFRHWLTPGMSPTNGQVVRTHALRCVTTALLMCVWSVARAHGKFVDDDLHLAHSDVTDLDEIAGAPGVGAAMEAVQWVERRPGTEGLWMPNFVEFNVPMTGAEKQKNYRDRKKAEAAGALPRGSNESAKNVTSREEKRRVLKNKQKGSGPKPKGAGPQPFSAVLQGSESPVENAIANANHLFNLGQITAAERDDLIEKAKSVGKGLTVGETQPADTSTLPAGVAGIQQEGTA